MLRNYEGALWIFGILIFFSVIFLKDFVGGTINRNGVGLLLAIFLLLALAVFMNQYLALKLEPVHTIYSRSDDYLFAKKTIAALQWKVKQVTRSLIEALNPAADALNWQQTMITAVITDNEIMIIGTASSDEAPGFKGTVLFSYPFWHNLRAVKLFIETFERIGDQ